MTDGLRAMGFFPAGQSGLVSDDDFRGKVRVMRIDVHAHYWTEDYLDLLVNELAKTDTGVARGIGAGGGNELKSRLRLMDRAAAPPSPSSTITRARYSASEASASLPSPKKHP